jgi:hypothetical protein
MHTAFKGESRGRDKDMKGIKERKNGGEELR